MNSLQMLRAERLVDRLTVGQEEKHTAAWVRTVRDDEALSESERDLLTAYAWALESAEPPPRSSRPVLSLLTALAEAEQDAYEMGGERFAQRHGFAPVALVDFRLRAVVAGRALLEVLP